ncbi:MAG: hypothetical protein Q7J65_02940 [Candidatus Marinimicrobia bacterium]|nr:hypothetical protein [Candidatus Neomarinimicrobiota bacterium]
MNNFLSLQYFIPEFILLLNVFFLFFSSETKQRHLIKVRQILLITSIFTVIVLYLIRWFDRPYGLFYNSFVLDPFSNMFSILLLLTFLTFDLPEIRRIKHSNSTDILIQKLIILTASILLVKANSSIGILLCIGLIYIGNSIAIYGFSHAEKDRTQINTILTSQILLFGLLFFGFSIIYGFTGSLYFHAVHLPVTALSESPLNYCFLSLFLILGLGLFGIILPFRSLREEHHQTNFANYYSSSYLPVRLPVPIIGTQTGFIPFLAMFGSLIRILNGIIPLIQNGVTVPSEYKYFVAGLSICLIAGANCYYLKRKTINDLFTISLIIHYGLVISGLAVFTREALTASIYLIVSTTIILAGIIILQKNEAKSTQSKLIKTVFYLGLIGMPGTPGFTGRFLLLKSLYNAGVPLWLMVSIIISILPIIHFYTKELIRLHHTETNNSGLRFEYFPALLVIFSFLMVVYWEPFVQLITKSLVFFN